MTKRITVIQSHSDPMGNQFGHGHALANAYTQSAKTGGHEVRHIDVAKLNFPILRTKDDGENGRPSESIRQSQEAIGWANHLMILYPLWLGAMPRTLRRGKHLSVLARRQVRARICVA